MQEKYTCVILGGSSDIARAYTRRLIQEYGASLNLIIVGRNKIDLEADHKDFEGRGAGLVESFVCDLSLLGSIDSNFNNIVSEKVIIDEALIAYGILGDNEVSRNSTAFLSENLVVNFVSVAAWSQKLLNLFIRQDKGHLSVIGSVAGDRGRQSNYVYGSAKGGLDTFITGLQHSIASVPNVSVNFIKPGFVDTSMTVSFKKGPLWVSPEKIATIITKAKQKKKLTVYAPWFWRWIMLIIRSVPTFVFHKTKL